MTPEPTNTFQQRQDYIMEFLRNEGYRPVIDEDDDIAFQREGRWYYITLEGEDDIYYRLFKGEFWKINNDGERERAFQASSIASGEIKAAKVFLNTNRDNVVAVLESFHHSTIDFTLVFERSLSALGSVVDCFTNEMTRLQKATEQDKKVPADQNEFSQVFIDDLSP